MERLIPLGSREALDGAAVGAKAAGLSRAMKAGLPVLPGWALPVSASTDTLRAGAEALDARGRAAATLAVSRIGMEEAVARDLSRVAHGAVGSSVVRSSTPTDDDGRWAGAFATYHDVERGLLPIAVRGCWASAFSSNVLARCRHLGLPVTEIGVGIVIQPWLAFAFGGTATCHPDDRVELTVAAGGPAGVVGGLGSSESIDVPPGRDGDVSRVVTAAVALSRETAAATCDDRIEWGWVDGRILLLQAETRPAAPRTSTPPMARLAPGSRLRSLARTVARYRAPLGDELVVPWALAGGEPPPTVPIVVEDPVSALAEASALAARLAGDAWNRRSDAALRAASELTRVILGSDPDRGIARMPPIRLVDPTAVERLLSLVDGIGVVLTSRGMLQHPGLVWRLSTAELRAVLEDGAVAPSRSGPDRWEPFVFQVVVAAASSPAHGFSASPGIGAGPLHVISGAAPTSPPPPRAVVAARAPLPQLAPLLFGASGVVSAGGGPGAHLFEVARSLGIPAVVGVDLTDAAHGDALVAVDGSRAQVSLLERAPAAVSIGSGGG